MGMEKKEVEGESLQNCKMKNNSNNKQQKKLKTIFKARITNNKEKLKFLSICKACVSMKIQFMQTPAFPSLMRI